MCCVANETNVQQTDSANIYYVYVHVGGMGVMRISYNGAVTHFKNINFMLFIKCLNA